MKVFVRAVAVICFGSLSLLAADQPEFAPSIWDIAGGIIGTAPAPGLSANSFSNSFEPSWYQLGFQAAAGYSLSPANLRLTWDASRTLKRKVPLSFEGRRDLIELFAATDVNAGIQFRTSPLRKVVFYTGVGGGFQAESGAYAPIWNANLGAQIYTGPTWGFRFETRYMRTIGNFDNLSVSNEAMLRASFTIFKQFGRR